MASSWGRGMAEGWEYYWRVVLKVFTPQAFGHADLLAGVLVSLAAYIVPKIMPEQAAQQTMGELAWQLFFWALAAVVSFRILAAPVSIYRDMKAENERLTRDLQAARRAPSDRTRQVRSRIAEFMNEGNTYLVIPSGEPPTREAVRAWTDRCEAYLREALGPEYVARFRTESSALPPVRPGVEQMKTWARNQWLHVQSRVQRLAEILDRLPDE